MFTIGELKNKVKNTGNKKKLIKRKCEFCGLETYYNKRRTNTRFQCYKCLAFNKVKNVPRNFKI